MALLHLSISATEAERVARFLARLLSGEAMPFPPFPDCWIAFSSRDDGTAIEVYPATHTLVPGPNQIACAVGEPDTAPTFAHAAFASPMDRYGVIALAEAEGWPARLCDRGPFECVEVWLEGRLLVEVLDAAMLRDYRAGMTMENWRAMFGLGPST